MPTFKRGNNREVKGVIDLVQGNTLRLKLDGVIKGSKATHYQIRSSTPLISISQNANDNQREQTITLNVSDTGTTRLATISAHTPGNSTVAASFLVNILPKLQLPEFGSEAGIVTQLLLAESLTPEFEAEYADGADVFRAMELMREVLDNRLAAARTSDALRSYVACNPATNDLRGVVQANLCGRALLPQFKGFDGSRSAPDPQQIKVINAVLTQANNGTSSLFVKARQHVEKAIEISARPAKLTAITDSSLLFWRTARSDPPSTYAIQKAVLAGQAFFSLNSSYLKNPQNPTKP